VHGIPEQTSISSSWSVLGSFDIISGLATTILHITVFLDLLFTFLTRISSVRCTYSPRGHDFAQFVNVLLCSARTGSDLSTYYAGKVKTPLPRAIFR
jgi:hypothetical protein